MSYEWNLSDGFAFGPFGYHTYYYSGVYWIYLDDEGQWGFTTLGPVWVN